MARVLGVDPGEARIGLAISDPTGLLARPFKVIKHVSRAEDAATIAKEAAAMEVAAIVIGLPLDQDGRIGHQARKSMRLVKALRSLTHITVKTWDESGTTKQALASFEDDSLLDARAAAFMLQDFLDAAE